MTKMGKIAWRIFVVISAILMVIMIYKIVITTLHPNKIPTFFGYSRSIVVSGSMEPTLSIGDMVICKEQNNYEINDVIAYYDEQEGVFILHRIIGKSVDGFYTKGDFNHKSDPNIVKLENIQGKVIIAIPNMKTIRDIAIGALLAILIEYSFKIIIHNYRTKMEKGGKEVNEKV